jgi:hypothetical protein
VAVSDFAASAVSTEDTGYTGGLPASQRCAA